MQPEEKDSQDRRFRQLNRLKTSAEFRNVFGKGRKIITPTLVFHVLKTERLFPRLGLAVSRKVGNAVKRNWVKRRIREAFRLKKGFFSSSFDIVAYPRKGILDKNFDDYLASFDILQRVVHKRSRSKSGSSRKV